MDGGTGVYFRNEDYAGLSRRLLIDLIDGLTAGAVCLAVTVALWGSVPDAAMLWSWVAIFYCYFAILKRSRFRTAGYRVAGVRIVGPDGQAPSLWSLSLRLIFMMLGPLNYLLDVIWLSGDPHRQALRDKFAQTYVVKKGASPAGTGKITYRYYEICGYNFLFREVETAPGAVLTRADRI